MAVHCSSDSGDEIPPEQGKLLASLALTAIRHLAADTLVLNDADKNWRTGFRMVRFGSYALIQKPADKSDEKRLQCIDCYVIETMEPGPNGHGVNYRLDPERALFSLDRFAGTEPELPPNFHLRARRDPHNWLNAVAYALLAALGERVPQLFEGLDSGAASLH
jgi:hypothetical protein